MPALASFNDFVLATAEKVVTDPKNIINDAVLNTYVMKDMVRGKGEAEIVKAGSSITDRTQLTTTSTSSNYDPNDQFSPVLQDVLTKISAPWRFTKSYWAWTDQEVMLNEGDRLVQWKSLRDSKRQACFVDMYNFMEAQLWATPSNTTMESTSTTGGAPYSVRCFVTEDGNAPAGFTTVMGVNPSSNTNWKNAVDNFAYASIATTLLPSFDRMRLRLNFESPDNSDNYFKETRFNKFKIYTNLDGQSTYAGQTRDNNDRAMQGNKYDLGAPALDPVYAGIPVKYISSLDNVGYATGQPRYFWLNFDTLFPVFHSQRYMYEKPPQNGGVIQPYTWVVFKDTWWNLFCRSRKRNGILVPV